LRPNQLFEELINAGLAVATIDHRLSLEAKFPAQLHDAKAAIRYLRAHADVLEVGTRRIGVRGGIRRAGTSQQWWH
jgi:acetyl esterase/lipase